jgi:hypothetical protein
MKTITIKLENNTVTITDGRNTEINVFNATTEQKQALISLAEFYGYDPDGILCFEDDNDFLQDLSDEAETEEMVDYWIEALLESTGKSNVDELTAEEIRTEIDDIEGTISNEEVVLGISEFAEGNIVQYKAYLEVLAEMLNNKEEI